jgi:hypothetical protein
MPQSDDDAAACGRAVVEQMIAADSDCGSPQRYLLDQAYGHVLP